MVACLDRMLKRSLAPGLVLCILLAPAPAAAEVRLTLGGGHVTLVATDATLTEILHAWSDEGQITFVNTDGLSTEPITTTLSNVREREALDVLLRSLSGYVAVERPAPSAGESSYRRIVLLNSQPVSRQMVDTVPAIGAADTALAGVQPLTEIPAAPAAVPVRAATQSGRGYSGNDRAAIPSFSSSAPGVFEPSSAPGYVMPPPPPPPVVVPVVPGGTLMTDGSRRAPAPAAPVSRSTVGTAVPGMAVPAPPAATPPPPPPPEVKSPSEVPSNAPH